MSILVLGSHSYQLVPDVNGDPLTVSPSGNVPAVTSGAGVPSGVPPYGNGTLYVDTIDNTLYMYKVSAWTQIGATLPNNLVTVLNKTTTDTVITGAGPGNTLSYAVPGGTLSTDKILRVKLSGRWLNGSGGTRSVTIAVSYGGTTMWSDTSPALANNVDVGWYMEMDLVANGSTTSQKLVGHVEIGDTGTTTTGLSGNLATDEILSTAIIIGNNAAINSANTQSLNITVTFSGTGTTWTKYYHTIELL